VHVYPEYLARGNRTITSGCDIALVEVAPRENYCEPLHTAARDDSFVRPLDLSPYTGKFVRIQ
jgi:hypothetical protein